MNFSDDNSFTYPDDHLCTSGLLPGTHTFQLLIDDDYINCDSRETLIFRSDLETITVLNFMEYKNLKDQRNLTNIFILATIPIILSSVWTFRKIWKDKD
jgi:hypothetical protein